MTISLQETSSDKHELTMLGATRYTKLHRLVNADESGSGFQRPGCASWWAFLCAADEVGAGALSNRRLRYRLLAEQEVHKKTKHGK